MAADDGSRTTRGRRLGILAGLLLAAAAIVVAAILVSQGGSGDSETTAGGGAGGGPTPAQQVRRTFAGVPQDGTLLGDPDIPVTLVEFADLQCPFCAQFARETLPTLIDEYVQRGRVKLQLELLAFLGPDSLAGARAAAVAAEQDRLWQFADLFFLQQGEENSGYADGAFLARLARQAGVELRGRGSGAERLLRQAARRAERFGIEGTPSFVLIEEGRRPQVLEVPGLDPASFTTALDEALG